MSSGHDSEQALKDVLRMAGVRVTVARLCVLRVVQSSKRPLSHAEVFELVQDQFDRATVYRNLIDLEGAGLIQRADVGDHTWRFEMVQRPHAMKSQHAHFICCDCGTVECLPLETVKLHPSARTPRAIKRADVEIRVRGVCDTCA